LTQHSQVQTQVQTQVPTISSYGDNHFTIPTNSSVFH
jgi:hypothetical protein